MGWGVVLNRAKAGRKYFLCLQQRHCLGHVSASQNTSLAPLSLREFTFYGASRDFKGPIVLFLLRHGANLSELLVWIYLWGCCLSCSHNARLGNTFCCLHSRSRPKPHTYTHFLLVIPVVRLGLGLAGELVKRLGTSCKVQSSRKDSRWAWRCSLGFTGRLSNYSAPSILCFFTYNNHRRFFPCLTRPPTSP